MRIAYVTTYDSNDQLAWSGLGHRIRRSLEEAGAEVTPVGPLSHKYGSYFRLKRAIHSKLSRRVYVDDREPLLLRHYAREISRALSETEHDVVFSPGTIPIAELVTKKPIVFWTDATFDAMLDYYPGFSNLSRASARAGRRMEQNVLRKSRLALYSSQWAADSALAHYDVDPGKVKVVPFGANLDTERTAADIEGIIARRRHDPVRLLFIGAEWERKRGDLAADVVRMLNERGIRAHLHTVGTIPDRPASPWVTHHGFLAKTQEEGRFLLDSLFAASTFLILPSSAECCAVVISEASSFGLPSLVTRVGGNETMIHDGVNGRAFALTDGPGVYCDFIQRTVASRPAYEALARSSFLEYSARLNWERSGAEVLALIRTHCA